jgi:hypothetical protein
MIVMSHLHDTVRQYLSAMTRVYYVRILRVQT